MLVAYIVVIITPNLVVENNQQNCISDKTSKDARVLEMMDPKQTNKN
jgi:hypothetical protein